MPDDEYRVLRRRVAEKLGPLGMTVEQFILIVPEGDEDAAHVQIAFKVDRAQLGVDTEKAAEQADFDKQFSALAEGFATQAKDDEADAAIQAAREMLSRHKPKEVDE